MPVRDDCFHCGNRLPAQTHHSVLVEGLPRAVCCGGCEAAANLILSQGLERYYRFRSAAPGAALDEDARHHWAVYDREAALRRYTHLRPDGQRELSLQIEGMHCAACAWLIESSLAALTGVQEIHVNATSARAQLRFDPRRLTLSAILERVGTLGYLPRPVSFSAAESEWPAQRRSALKRLAVAGFGMMQVMTYAASLYAGAMQGMAPNLEQLLRFVSLLVATPVVLYSAQPFFVAAWRSLRSGSLGMDVPVALSVGAAYGWSVCATLRGSGTVYFDSAVMFTFLLLLGRYVEMSLRHRCGAQQEAIARMLPEGVLRLRGEIAERVTPDELETGDCIRVLPGERVAADAVIESGSTEVDESLLNGESAPQRRSAGDTLLAGTVNLSGSIRARVARVGQDSTLAAMSRLLERAGASRPRLADLADRVAAWFVAAVLIIAAAVGVYWLHTDAARAFPTVLAVLVVTCPCALSLATPAALAAATTSLSRLGLLVARGRALERLARADCVVFDKTGTLTRGEPRIEGVRLLDRRLSADRCLALAAALERHSGHPVARAFAQFEPASGLCEPQSSIGQGLEACIEGRRYRIGRADYVLEIAGAAGDVAADAGTDAAHSRVLLGDQSGPLAEFLISDGLREDAAATLTRLRALGLEIRIASGDRDSVVAALAQRLGGIAWQGQMSAGDKLALVRGLQRQGHRVIMIGDGVNDAPVLAGADVSVAIGSGTDLARVSADLVLLGAGLTPLTFGIETARRMRSIIAQNLLWALLYNATAVPLAAAGVLAPWVAALGMSASSLLVVLNAVRLLGPRAHAAGAPHRPALTRVVHA
jgi:Cu2+-exporting ATPase